MSLVPRARRRPLVVVLLAVIGLLAAACGGDDAEQTAPPTTGDTAATTTGAADATDAADTATTTAPAAADPFGEVPEGTTLRVGDQFQQIEKLLELSGQLGDLPYEVAWSQFAGGPPLLEAFNAGAIDVGFVGELPPITAQAAGLDIVVIATSRNAGNTYKLVARADAGIESVEDLAGRTVGHTRGTAVQTFLGAALVEVGLDFDDVDLVDVPLSAGDYIATFQSGSVDAIAFPSAWWYLYDETNDDAVVVRDAEGLTTGQSYVITTSSVLEDPAKVSALADFIARQIAGQAWIDENQEAWWQGFAVETLGLPPGAAERIFTENGPTVYVPIDDEVIGRQQTLADQFFELGGIAVAVDVAERFDDRFNPVVAGGPAS